NYQLTGQTSKLILEFEFQQNTL
ncbi:PbsX family transcriptional regulator, partial [Bacillus cereus]